MKKIYFLLLGLVMIASANAQLAVGVNANYTMYRGDFQRSTPGAQLRVSYDFDEKITGMFGFTYGLPIKEASEGLVADQNGNTQPVATEFQTKFKTFHLLVHYTFVGDQESAGKFYGIAGAGLVLAKIDESVTGSYDKSKYSPSDMYSDKANGMTLNFGLGGEYHLGGPSLFVEGGISIPANKVNDMYVTNPIPGHFFFNAGVKFPLMASE